ncbi:hypothetical protein L596_007326 [Steinernema carpocapsae]|uniref:glucuronosyltransferase n=1 Tax=Steinernema carpocapsae TaxID=34508 RepID=A0A4U5P9C2_STECR|nr:hypothetical protein L596_007326 [Steinernema carpocapsae]
MCSEHVKSKYNKTDMPRMVVRPKQDSLNAVRGAAESRQRFDRLVAEFPELNFERLERAPFVLVSFGSVAQLENMPKPLLSEFLRRFAELPYTVLWQSNSPAVKIPMNVRIPRNVVLVRWAPIKNLLAHRNLRFVVCHGGVNTVNELLLFGVPVLGVPLQGDQSSNLQRLVDFGGALMINMKSIATGGLRAKLRELEGNYDRYSKRAELFSRMIRFHREFSKGSQNFWLNWAQRNGEKLRGRRLMDLKFRGSLEHFAIAECFCALVSFIFVVRILSA